MLGFNFCSDIMDVDEPNLPHVRALRRRPPATTDRAQDGWDIGMDCDLDDGSSISSSDDASSDDGRQGNYLIKLYIDNRSLCTILVQYSTVFVHVANRKIRSPDLCRRR